MYVNQDNWEDCKKYYEHTFTKFKETGDTIFYINKVTPDDIVAVDINKNEVGIDLTVGYNLEYVIPRKTVYQYGSRAYMISRIPAKQWKKGMCSSNTQIHYLDDQWMLTEFDMNKIEGFVNKPSYLTSAQGIPKLLNGECVSIALSPRFSMNNTGYVYLDSCIVGEYSFSNNVLKGKKIFAPEFKTLFPNTQLV